MGSPDEIHLFSQLRYPQQLRWHSDARGIPQLLRRHLSLHRQRRILRTYDGKRMETERETKKNRDAYCDTMQCKKSLLGNIKVLKIELNS